MEFEEATSEYLPDGSMHVTVYATKIAADSTGKGSSNAQGDGKQTAQETIDPSTRQNLLPFYLDPSNKTNQTFSFRPYDVDDRYQYGKINIIPEDCHEFDSDLGILMTVSKNLNDTMSEGSPYTTRDVLLNHIPGITIREYTQDTKLQLFSGLLKKFKQGVSDGRGLQDLGKEDAKSVLSSLNNDQGENINSKGFWEKIVDGICGDAFDQWFLPCPKETLDTKLVMKLTYCMYYRMIGATTTNRYVVPCNIADLMNTDGTDGFGQQNGFGIQSLGSTTGTVGKLFNFAFSNFNVVTQPIWQNSTRGKVPSGISVNFGLYNDTIDHAINNFLFVNTICPSNMFLQYGVWQLPPSVYDVKIDGGRRWFMCSGSTSCKYKGVLRDAPISLLEELDKLKNSDVYKFDAGILASQRLIKIPDVYDVTLNFNSLLPDSFNQFMYQYASEDIMMFDDGREEPFFGDTTSLGETLGKALGKVEDAIKKLKGGKSQGGSDT